MKEPSYSSRLGEELEPRALAVARPRAVARGVWLESGPWQPLADEWDHRGHLGLLIVDGFLTRSMQVGATRCAELLGPGDLLRPWVHVDLDSSIPIEGSWQVLDRTLATAASNLSTSRSPGSTST